MYNNNNYNYNYINEQNNEFHNFNNNNGSNNNTSYSDCKSMNYLPTNFNPRCTNNNSTEEISEFNNSNNVEQNNTIFSDPYFKNLVKTELEITSSHISHDTMEIDEESKILSPPNTPN